MTYTLGDLEARAGLLDWLETRGCRPVNIYAPSLAVEGLVSPLDMGIADAALEGTLYHEGEHFVPNPRCEAVLSWMAGCAGGMITLAHDVREL